MDKERLVIITDSLDGLEEGAYEGYLAHALCLGGECRFTFNEKPYVLREGDLTIVRKLRLISGLRPSDDFKVKVLFVKSSFIELCMPATNYGLKGSVAMFLNPVMHLNADQRYLCLRNFDWIEWRLSHTDHHFYQDLLLNAVQGTVIDFFDFHSQQNGKVPITNQNASIFGRFMSMLDNGEYRTHREVSWYAEQLCVTPKYLSEISKKVCGYSANYWINRYTILDISRLIRDRSLTFNKISDMFGFSSPAYFSKYVQRFLGMSPTDYRA